VAAWAEFQFGAARYARDSMALFTVGTGIGGGIIIGGQLIRGAHGIAAELGHTVLVPDGYPCGCGRHGCVEQYASGHALVRFSQLAAREKPEAAERLLELAGGTVEGIDGPMVTRAARAGDPAALSAFEQIGHWLGVAMADLVQVIDPQVIVIGGGVVHAGDLLLRPARREFERALEQRGRLPVAEVRPALLGNLAGVVGAADLARRV
jgi:glucokinase